VTPAVGVSAPSWLASSSLAPVALRGTGVTGSSWPSASGVLETVRTRGVSGSGCGKISPSAGTVRLEGTFVRLDSAFSTMVSHHIIQVHSPSVVVKAG
jgi:hypothetical protein